MDENKKAALAVTGTAQRTAFAGEIIAEIPKNSREVYRITRSSYKGHNLVDLRVWFYDLDTGELRPGKSGVSIKVEALPEITMALFDEIQKGSRHE